MFEGDANYFRRRAAEERAAAGKAMSEIARDAHLDLAERYDELAVAIAARELQPVRDSLRAV